MSRFVSNHAHIRYDNCSFYFAVTIGVLCSCRTGRTEMAMLAKNWQTLDGEDFVAFKDRLELQ